MLAYILAIAVGLSSLALYIAAFFFPEIHRKDDFLWSGVGLFYALVLWVCAGRITGGILLGQTAAVSLTIVFGWQTLKLRRAIAHPEEKTDLEGFSLTELLQAKLFNRGSKQAPTSKSTVLKEEADASVAQTEEEEPLAVSQEAEEKTDLTKEIVETSLEAETEVEETTVPETLAETETLAEEQISTEPEIESAETEAKIQPNKGSFLNKLLAPITNLFGKSKSKPKSPSSLTEELDQAEPDTDLDLFLDDFEEETPETEKLSTKTVEILEVEETTSSESEEEIVTLEETEAEPLTEGEGSETIDETKTSEDENTESPEEGEIIADSSKSKHDQD